MPEWAMRVGVDLSKLQAFMDEVGRAAQSAGRVYLVGGASALLLGVREQTIDVDIKLDPEPKAIFESIARLKNKLHLNVELASPDQFLPALPGWQDRSEFIVRRGAVDFFHYDFYAQTLAKLLRGHGVDLADARAFFTLGKVDPSLLLRLFNEVRSSLIRYPAIDPQQFALRVEQFVREVDSAS